MNPASSPSGNNASRRRRSSVRFHRGASPSAENASASGATNLFPSHTRRPATTAFQTRREKQLYTNDDSLDISHINQQIQPLYMKNKQQIHPLLPASLIATKDAAPSSGIVNELKRFYKKGASAGQHLSQPSSLAHNNQRDRVYEAWNVIHERFSNEALHPQLKARHVEDLFQISAFVIKDQASLVQNYQGLQRDNELLRQQVRQYEEMHKSDHDLVVKEPSQDDLRKLQQSVKALRKEIADYSQVHMKDVHQQIDNGNNGEASEREPQLESLQDHQFVSLLQQKFELLEDFVVALKKKIHSLEQVDEDVKKLGGNFGSVNSLLKENEKLQDQRYILEWSKKRFDVDYLLRIEHTHSKDPAFLRTLAFALQRELTQCRETLKYFNFEENSALKLGVVVEHGPLRYSHKHHGEYADLNELMADLFVDEDEYDDEPHDYFAKNSQSAGTSHRSQSLDQQRKIEIISQENKLLHEQVKRHLSELKETKNLLSLLESQYKHHSNSKFELKEIEITARRMMEQLTKLNHQTTERENAYIFQQKLVEKMNKQEEHMEAQIARLSERLLTEHVKQKELRSKWRTSKQSIQTLHTIAVSLIHLYMEDENRRKQLFGSVATGPDTFNHVSAEHMISFMYRDLYNVYVQSTEAAIRIQSAWRGVQTRRNLLRNGFYNIIIKKPKSDKLDARIKQAIHVDENAANTSAREALALRHTVATGNLKRTIETTRMLQHLILIQESDTKKLEQLQTQLKILKGSLENEFKEQVQVQLDGFKETMKELGSQMTQKVHRVTTVPMANRSIQTDTVEKRTRQAQVGAAQFSNTVVKSFHERLTGSSGDSKGKKK
uniref:Uncharacterized protein n=1 Tax=Percolomonas cosmopolitus TaxID=63605 RepID=A0A7S1PJW3_9EUKA|mmetsp:Transcript_7543/g.28344  ORF Transcript_7543/g.28344 Transcript_7543/m.28344 type:complete len:836 (+) Transcript_7543:2-2509(+)